MSWEARGDEGPCAPVSCSLINLEGSRGGGEQEVDFKSSVLDKSEMAQHMKQPQSQGVKAREPWDS